MSKQVSVEEFKTAMMAVVEKGTDRSGLSEAELSEAELSEVKANEEICWKFARQRIRSAGEDSPTMQQLRDQQVDEVAALFGHLPTINAGIPITMTLEEMKTTPLDVLWARVLDRMDQTLTAGSA